MSNYPAGAANDSRAPYNQIDDNRLSYEEWVEENIETLTEDALDGELQEVGLEILKAFRLEPQNRAVKDIYKVFINSLTNYQNDHLETSYDNYLLRED